MWEEKKSKRKEIIKWATLQGRNVVLWDVRVSLSPGAPVGRRAGPSPRL